MSSPSRRSARKKPRRRRPTRAALEAQLAAARAATNQKAKDLLAIAADKTKPYGDRVRAFIDLGKMVGLNLGERLLNKIGNESGSVH